MVNEGEKRGVSYKKAASGDYCRAPMQSRAAEGANHRLTICWYMIT
jgi:hypothetical protein